MSVLSSPENFNAILNLIQVIILAAIGAAGAAYKYTIDKKTEHWEKMTQQAVDSSQQAVSLIKENTRLTRHIGEKAEGTANILKSKLDAAAKKHTEYIKDELDSVETQDVEKPIDNV